MVLGLFSYYSTSSSIGDCIGPLVNAEQDPPFLVVVSSIRNTSRQSIPPKIDAVSMFVLIEMRRRI